MRHPLRYLFLPLLFFVQVIHAQKPASISNLRKKAITVKDDVVKLDSMSIVPGSVSIENILPGTYKINELTSTLTWLTKPKQPFVWVTYRVFPFKLNAVVKHYDYDSIRYNFSRERPVVFTINEKQGNPLFDFGTVKSEGSFAVDRSTSIN